MSKKIIGVTVGTPMNPQKVVEKTNLQKQVEQNKKDIGELSGQKADKAYVVAVFEELKNLIQNGQTDSAIAVLDKAILDLSILA